MNIDRKRFLVLVTTLSASATAVVVVASGCTITNTNANANNNGGLADGSTLPPTGDSGDSTPTTDGSVGSDAGSCVLNTTPGPNCGGGGPDGGTVAKCPSDCARYGEAFLPDIALAIRQCMDLAPTCEGYGQSCGKAAMAAQTCDDPTAKSLCTDYLACQSSGGIDGGFDSGVPGTDAMTACVSALRSLSPAGRDEFKTCLSDYGGACAPSTLADCINGLTLQN